MSTPNGFVIRKNKNRRGQTRFHVNLYAGGRSVWAVQPKGYTRRRAAHAAIARARKSALMKVTEL